VVLAVNSTRPHPIRIEYRFAAPLFGAGVTLEWQPPADVLQAQAVRTAQQADAIVAFVGLSPRLEGEEMPLHVAGFNGGDRTSIELPAAQQRLLRALQATGKPLVVVLMSGSAVAMNGLSDHAAALLEAWYPGEAGGEAIANVLRGTVNPSGRLPITFYKADAQLPPFTDYSMKNRTYRYFTGERLFPFGYGLSYSKFRYSELNISADSIAAGDPLAATVTVTNEGPMAGDAVAEVYLIPPQAAGAPRQQLVGFQRVHLAAHGSRTVQFQMAPRTLSQVDEAGRRAIRSGEYRLFVGAEPPAGARDDVGVSTRFSITGEKALND
jgi:beta-glucosidase